MEDGLVKDELTTATTTAAVRGSSSMCAAAIVAAAVAARRWWLKLTPTKRTIALTSLALAAVMLLLARYTAHEALQNRRWKMMSECQEYAQLFHDWAVTEDINVDSFGVSIDSYPWGYSYSYKQGGTGVTDGPRILLLLDVLGDGFWQSFQSKERYSIEFAALPSNRAAAELYSFELTIGQDAYGNIAWFSSDESDDTVFIDPSVVHLGFSNGATYSIYNDTVFLLSYKFTGYELQVEERPIDLSGVVWTNCTSVKDLFQRNADLAVFDAQWRTNSQGR
jgi:hypothetical protein